MKKRTVEFTDEAKADLLNLYDWIASCASPEIALNYVERLEAYCKGFDIASERGTARHDIRPNLRIVGFERSVTIAFTVEDTRVIILRLYYGGQDWSETLQ